LVDAGALRARLTEVRERIARAADRAHRDPSSIRLVAISKTHPADDVRGAALAGQLEFGENRVQEALPKISATADLSLTWHLVGHLQSNKARRVAEQFDVVQSVHDADLLRKLDEGAAASRRRLEVLIQADLAREPTKHGAPRDTVRSIFAAARDCRTVKVVGLMLLPPAVDDPQDARPYFRELHGLKQQLLADGVEPSMLAELSMGMSHDFEVAVEEGATIVRVGTAIFGPRN